MYKLVFNPKVAKNKPRDVAQASSSNICPFCHTEDLTDILKTDGDRIWLMNKFRTLEDTAQTFIIESAQHDGDFRIIHMKSLKRLCGSPYFVGYKIPQVNSDERVDEIVQELKNCINKKAK